ncbi:MAG: L-iditol 2-dehydrogenase, partial [Candidatus Eremiobacteraeota bacterium]|nr:L-iditol 2-dehydrogenase [Candidatus Eremiobacteraeota bacterium]
MIAARYWAPRDVRVEQVPEPEPAAGEVVLRIEAALTCGTDAKCYRRGHPVLLGPAPAPFGHEYAGIVIACGEDAPFDEGDLVCGVNSAPCGECQPCAAGREELCAGLYPLLNGAYAQMLRVPARIARVNLHRVPEGVPPEVAAAIEPLACAVHGADDAGARPGQRIAILGRGALG